MQPVATCPYDGKTSRREANRQRLLEMFLNIFRRIQRLQSRWRQRCFVTSRVTVNFKRDDNATERPDLSDRVTRTPHHDPRDPDIFIAFLSSVCREV